MKWQTPIGKIPTAFLPRTWLFFLFIFGVSVSQARTPKDLFQNGDLTNGSNYSPAGTPTSANDLLLSTAATVLTLNGATLDLGSLNQTNNLAYTVSNNAPGTANSTLTLGNGGGTNGTSGASPADLIYLGGATSSLTLQGPNGDDGIGLLGVSMAFGNLNVAQAAATLSISSNLTLTSALTKTGAGTLNLSGQLFGSGAIFAVNAGTANILSGVHPNSIVLGVNNPNTGAGSATILNLFGSSNFYGLMGTIATPSSGVNTATLNLVGAATQLALFIGTGEAGESYAGTIAGDGSVSFNSMGGAQTLSGNNTYTGTTTVIQGTLNIDGNTSGQGDYMISRVLAGHGSIGLKPNGNINIGGTLAPGGLSSLGTLSVTTSGTGGVTFGNGSVLDIDVGGAGLSDQLIITGGVLNLTSAGVTLRVNALANAFDGSADYTIATFPQNLNGSTFSTVQNVFFPYVIQYNPTSIRLVAQQLPLEFTSVYSRKAHGSVGSFDIDLLAPNGVECRTSGGSHTLIFNFTNYLVSGSVSVTAGIGNIVGTPVFSSKTVMVNLDGVADAQRLNLTFHGVTDRFSQVMPDTVFSFLTLVGDANGNKVVNASDVSLVKLRSGSVTNGSNFREDLNLNGVISASDLGLVKASSGAFIPP